MERRKARITVLKRMDNRKVQEEHKSDGARLGPCRLFEDGQTFVAGWRIPEGFCDTAWADIHSDLVMIQWGGNPGYVGPDHTMISCCRDGFRPVVFKIERLDEPVS
ncbi:TIGR04076 family protein [Candidatus Bipolaricaulota bacterium]